MNEARRGTSRVLSSCLPCLILLAAGLAIISPEFATGPSTSDSIRYNIVWTDQWRALVAARELYPRWMPRSWDGLGSPTFYFYPPLFFWAAAAADLLTARALQTGALLTLTAGLILGASGIAMRAWLLAHAAPRAAMLGGLAYMLAPYHLYDILARAALAESCAYAALPVVMLSVKRAAEGRTAWVSALAASYAVLTLSHLPVGLLTSVILLPAYAIHCSARAVRRLSALASVAAGGLLGVGLAAAYLVPAIGLQPYILAEAFSGEFHSPDRWFFWRVDLWSQDAVMWVVIPTWAAAGLAAASAARASWVARTRETLFWCAACAAMLVLASGIPPVFWSIPLLSQVQFPWRLLVPIEFAAVTCVVLAAPKLRSALSVAAVVSLAFAATVCVMLIGTRLAASVDRSAGDIATIRTYYRDAPEYLPAGSPLPLGEDGVPDPWLVPLPQGPAVEAGEGAKLAVAALPRGGLRINVESDVATQVVARRFAFPSWILTDATGQRVAIETTAGKLVAWRAPAGRSEYLLRQGAAPGERMGQAASAASLLVLLALGAAAVFRARARGRGQVPRSPLRTSS